VDASPIIQRRLTNADSLICNDTQRQETHKEDESLTDNDSVATSSVSSLSSDSSDSEAPSEVSYGSEPMLPIRNAIARLHRLSMAIKRPSVVAQNSKAAYYVEYEDGVDVIQAFEQFTMKILEARFKDSMSPFLQKRLSQANAIRRQRFLYKQRHTKKLQERKDSGTLNDGLRPKRTGSQITRSTMLMTNRSSYGDQLNKTSAPRREESVRLSETTASKFDEGRFWKETASSRVSTVMSANPSLNDAVQFPPVPRIPVGSTEFICPHCYIPQPSKDATQRKWR
jgi:hypothetical protein